MSFSLLGCVISIIHSPIAPQSTVLIISDIHKNNHTDVNVIHANLCQMGKPFTGTMGNKTREALAVRFHWCTKTQSDECFPKAFDYTMSIPSPRVCLQGCVCWACGEGVTFSALLLFVFILFCFIFPRPALTSLRFEVGYCLQPVLCSCPWFLT